MSKIKNFLNDRELIFLLPIILVYLIFGLYLVSNINEGISPDESYHIKVSSFYSKSLLIPENSEETFPYGEITRIPYLGFWLNARLINLNFTQVEDYVILRFFNLIISVSSLFVVYFISREVINKKYYNLLPTFLLANTLMFVFLSSAVSYDNLSNLFVFLTIYFFVKYFKYKQTKFLLSLLIFQILSILTKFTIAPIIFIELILVGISLIREGRIKILFKESVLKYRIQFIIMVLLITFCFLLYGINYLKYNQIIVSCEKILTTEECMKNGIFVRDENFEKFAVSNFSELKGILKNRITPFEYLSDWVMAMGQRTFGIMGGKNLFMHKYFVNIYLFLFGVLTFIGVRKWKKRDSMETRLIILSVLYILVLLIFQNYKTYFERNMFGLALQGRYLFPVLPVVYIVLIRYLSEVKPKWIRMIITTLLILVFLLGCIPFFFKYVPESWFV